MARILLLEPDRVLASQYGTFLTEQGHQVQAFAEAQGAIVAADADKPDVIIAELLLAGHSGIEFLYELRSYPEWHDIPVIVLTRIPPDQAGLTSDSMQELRIATSLYKPDTTLQKLAAWVEKVLLVDK